MIDHILAMAGHEALHRLIHAYGDAKKRGNAQEYLLAMYELLETMRLNQLLPAAPSAVVEQQTARALAQVLAEAREHRPDYWPLQQKHPAQFEALQKLLATTDYDLRDKGQAPLHHVPFQKFTYELRSALEGFGWQLYAAREQAILKSRIDRAAQSSAPNATPLPPREQA
ncbi:hypothetical protein ACPWT1_03830 [Ramlibacter sp. MMS24-I3-19]|uniref:hypothetical protein n=1 Tax=Ramlibacter sp. MMS24-I3-19 TaxID=3416606 RepID=UPI003D037258